jgi:hypothetical protein
MDELDLEFLIVAVALGVASLAAARSWPGGARVRTIWTGYVRRAPATLAYAAILAASTWIVAGDSASAAQEILRDQSTNLHNLRVDSADVLVRSAFWSGTTTLLPVIATLAVVLVPAEAWLGTRRLVLVFAAGHVGATLATAVALSNGYVASGPDGDVEHAIDVGISYGALAVAAVLTYRLPRRWRPPYGATLVFACGALALAPGAEFADFGHLVAILIGFAVAPLVLRHHAERGPSSGSSGGRQRAGLAPLALLAALPGSVVHRLRTPTRPERAPERHGHDPEQAGHRHVGEDGPPRQLVPPLVLADRDLQRD